MVVVVVVVVVVVEEVVTTSRLGPVQGGSRITGLHIVSGYNTSSLSKMLPITVTGGSWCGWLVLWTEFC